MKNIIMVKGHIFLVVITCIILCSLTLSACGSSEGTSKANLTPKTVAEETSKANLTPKTVVMEASWANWYTDLNSLKQDADIVALGTILKANPSVLQDGYAQTSFLFSISELILDQKKLTQNTPTIVINQTGGLVDNVFYEMHEDPLFKQGERTLLFLRFNEARTQTYVIGGPSGRFTLENGKVLAVAKNGVVVNNSLSETQFVANIKALFLEPKTSPISTKAATTPRVNPGQSVNLFQFYGLDKTQSILLKVGPNQNKTITDKLVIANIATSLNKIVIAQEKSVTSSLSESNNNVFVVFIFFDGTSVGFEYNRTASTITSNLPDTITIQAPANFAQILGLS